MNLHSVPTNQSQEAEIIRYILQSDIGGTSETAHVRPGPVPNTFVFQFTEGNSLPGNNRWSAFGETQTAYWLELGRQRLARENNR